ncbi:MAG: hypothetical protein J6D26_07195 [Clostridia bacterium]|nr:hypothetical protein [Clostridia bacterium]
MKRIICILLITVITTVNCVPAFAGTGTASLPSGPAVSENFENTTVTALYSCGWVNQGDVTLDISSLTDTKALKISQKNGGIMIPLTEADGTVMTHGDINISLSVRASAAAMEIPVLIAEDTSYYAYAANFNKSGSIDNNNFGTQVEGDYAAYTWYDVNIKAELGDKNKLTTTVCAHGADTPVASATNTFTHNAKYLWIKNASADAGDVYIDDVIVEYSSFAPRYFKVSVSSDLNGNVFYDQCGTVFITLTNPYDADVSLNLGYTIKDSLGAIALEQAPGELTLKANSRLTRRFTPDFSLNGAYELEFTITGDSGYITTDAVKLTVIDSVTVSDDEVGVSTHFAFVNREQPEDSFGQISSAGFGWIRDEIYWKDAETADGYKIPEKVMNAIEYANAKGMKVLIILNTPNNLYDNGAFPTSDEAVEAYGKFCGWVAKQLKGKVDAFEIWNEPNIADFTGGKSISGEDYVRILKSAYRYIKSSEGNPDATVLGGALTNMLYSEEHTETRLERTGEEFLQEILDAGGVDYMDAFSFHPYTYKRIPADEDWQMTFYGYLDTVSRMLDAAGAENMDIWATEYGRQGSSDYDIPVWRDEFQAVSTSRVMVQAKAYDRLKKLIIYNYKAKGTDPADEEHSFGIVDYNYYPKDVYVAIAYANTLLNGAEFSDKHIETVTETSGITYNMYSIYSFDKPSKSKKVYAIWGNALYGGEWYPNENKNTYVDITATEGDGHSFFADTRSAQISVPAGWELNIYDMYGNFIQTLGEQPYRVYDNTVYAIAAPKAVQISAADGFMNISGVTDAGREITLAIKKNKADFDEGVYIRQLTTDADGCYSLLVPIAADDVYLVKIYDSSKDSLTDNEISTCGFDVWYDVYQEGKRIKNLNDIDSAKDIKVDVSIKAMGNTDNLVAYGAVYNNDNNLISIDGTGINWTNSSASAELTIPANASEQINRLKLMLWNDKLVPICGALRLER